MSSSLGSGLTSITGSVTATAPTPKVLQYATRSTDGTMYTVPAGKVGHIIGYAIHSIVNSTASGNITLTANAVQFAVLNYGAGAGYTSAPIKTMVFDGATIPLTATQTVTFTDAGGGGGYAEIYYYEENA